MAERILFLDIDGVLNDHTWSEEAESCTLKPECVRAFNRLLRHAESHWSPGFGVIVTSAWRYMVFREVMTWPGFGYMLRTHGVSKLISRFIAGTTHPDEKIPTRGGQIHDWVTAHGRSPSFAILDDAPDGMDFSPVEHRLVKTNGLVGLTHEDVDRVMEMFAELPNTSTTLHSESGPSRPPTRPDAGARGGSGDKGGGG